MTKRAAFSRQGAPSFDDGTRQTTRNETDELPDDADDRGASLVLVLVRWAVSLETPNVSMISMTKRVGIVTFTSPAPSRARP